MTELPFALAAIVRRLEERTALGQAPDRHDARALLVELGQHLCDGPGAAIDVERLRGSVGALGGPWLMAVREELELACAEYIRSVDPRFLGLANYDFEYTLTARERLEARLVAAHALGIEAPVLLVSEVERADRALAARLEDEERAGGAEGSPFSSE